MQDELEPWLQKLLLSKGRPIKESPAKLVTVHELAGKSFFVKRYRHSSVRFRPLKFFLKRSQAAREWRLARQLETLQIPIVRHLALGERWGLSGLKESILITEGFAGRPLNEVSGFDREALLQFLDQLHSRGIVHPDLHPGNILVNSDSGALRLVDLHGTRIRRALTASERASNLSLIRDYLPPQAAAKIHHLAAGIRKRSLARRSKRSLKHNREFGPRSAGALKWHVRERFLSAQIEKILEDPNGFLSRCAGILKSGRSATIGRDDGVVLKRYNLRDTQSAIKDLFRASRARRAFRKAYHLELTGVPTARPIATADRRKFFFLVESYFLMEEIREATTLAQWEGDKRQAVRAIADLIARLHNEGFTHRDLKAANLVFDASAQLFLLDLEGLEFVNTISAKRAALDLERLSRSTQGFPNLTHQDRMNFLRRYCHSRGIRITAIYERRAG